MIRTAIHPAATEVADAGPVAGTDPMANRRRAVACSAANDRPAPAATQKRIAAAAVSYYRRLDEETNRRLWKQACVLSVADTLDATATRRLCVSVRTLGTIVRGSQIPS
jgi:hypothetical protein